MSTKESKELVRSYFEALSGKDKPREVIARYVSSEGLIDHILLMESAFPRYELIVGETVAEEDRVAVRMVFRGRHEGVFQGLPPTGIEATMPVAAFYHIEEGRIAEAWVQADGWALMQQLSGEEIEEDAE